ncbi:hypothetical protein LCGC14_1483080 [marine sediment metagenome]|uniref:Uncharacterized protein n=1 Tax=marine sediment metagenome TaxID=412755 RepID=A0A0F9JUV7_9ZZZZ
MKIERTPPKVLGYELETEVDWKSWAMTLATLLDRIELESDKPETVRKLCHMRFEVAKSHGATIVFEEPISGLEQ